MESKSKEKRQLWILYGAVVSSVHKAHIIRLLREKPMTPTQIKRRTELNLSHISRLLKNLEQRRIVECLNPDQRKGRLYSLTERGLWISNQLD